MKVVHICRSLEGGAGLCAKRIIQSTLLLGIDARAVVAKGERTERVDVIEPVCPRSKFWLIRIVQFFLRRKGIWPKTMVIYRRIASEKQKNNADVTFTSPVTLYRNVSNHPWVREADLVHLHWIGDFVDYSSFFKAINKPIVWTIHDENPGLGGFHYQMWKDGATKSFKKLDDELALIKEKAYQNVKSMTLVAISTMMQTFFEKNSLLSKFPSIIIHNGVEEKCFFPISTECSREALGLPENSVVFLFVAQNIHEDRKGLKELIAALETLKVPNLILICLGNYAYVPKTSFEIRCEGFVGNSRLQSIYYSAANFFIMPSYQEAFAQSPIEAMVCGTPAIAFPCSGSRDLINQDNGVVCEDFTVDALVKGIRTAMSTNYKPEKIREDVINRFSYQKIAKQYVNLYETLYHNSQL